MPHLPVGVARAYGLLLLLILLSATFSLAQLETATISGQVSDPSGLSVSGAQVNLVDIDRGNTLSAVTSNSGLYRLASVQPGRYRMEVRAPGFRVINFTGLIVNVQDHLEQNFRLTVGSVSESVTVEGAAPLVDSESAAVSTVVNRNFVDNLPMNGRSFQTLIQLTPGVVLTTSSAASDGQFSVNGQRASSNYWTVDGVSANIGISAGAVNLGNNSDTPAGAIGGFSAQGGTNGLVSIDAMQEFRIQTSTFAPEFGRMPGAQISIVTRSGTNQFHGTIFDYLRNDIFDANDWFSGYTNNPPLPKPEERQNDFGGTFGGPLLKDRTFFFFSYEGLRLRLPQITQTTVPTVATRQAAIQPMQAILNAFPLPNPNAPDLGDGSAQLNASYSNQSTLDAASLRLDHRWNNRLLLFGRYNYSPSEAVQRPGGFALSVLETDRITTQTATLGATWAPFNEATNDFRINYSHVGAQSHYSLSTFDGAVPFSLSNVVFPSQYDFQNSDISFLIYSLAGGSLSQGRLTNNVQRQFNVVDTFSLQKGTHALKFGADYRRLTPVLANYAYNQTNFFLGLSEAEAGNLFFASIQSSGQVPLVVQNLGLFCQDTWRLHPRLTLTYGLRWDVDFAPTTSSGPPLPAVTNFQDLATLALAPSGAPVFQTTYGNLAPRVGVGYELSQTPGRESVLRGGWGIFYDLATAQLGVYGVRYPFGAVNNIFGGQYPLDSASVAPPPISAVNPGVYAFDPKLKLPYVQQWNLSLEQSLGKAQALSASYVGAIGRRLLQLESITAPNPNIAFAQLVGNYATSDYHSLQLQFQRRLSEGLQALASYTWAHSIDTASSGAGGYNYSDYYVRSLGPNVNRGPSDFDIRNGASVAFTYAVPPPRSKLLPENIFAHWSLQSIFQARSAVPVDVSYQYSYLIGGTTVGVRPDLTPDVPLYLYGNQYPGGKAFNNTVDPSRPTCVGPFCLPPIDPTTGEPARQGDLGRNALRGFGAWQWDFAIHRDFPIREKLTLQFRAEFFNILNHPNFGSPEGNIENPPPNNNPFFGLSTQTLANSLDGFNQGSGSFSALYQLGGPRSAQFALKLSF